MRLPEFQTTQLGEISAGANGWPRSTGADIDTRIPENDATIAADFRESVEYVCEILGGELYDAGSLASHPP